MTNKLSYVKQNNSHFTIYKHEDNGIMKQTSMNTINSFHVTY